MDPSHWTPADVVGAGFCIGCGLCASRLGENVVTLKENADGLDEPVELRALTASETAEFETYCPGARMSGPEASDDATFDPMWGAFHDARPLAAADPETRFASSTGGALTGIARHLLASEEVAFIQHVRRDSERPLHSVPTRSESFSELAAAAGSRYAPTPALATFDEALADGRPFAFVGRPCDVMAVRQLAEVDPRVDERCKYLLTFMCGGTSSMNVTRRQLREWDTDEASLEYFSWRGHGCPGPVVARTQEGEEHIGNYSVLWGSDEANWQLLLRCKLCPDAIGLSADIVASDNWSGGNPPLNDKGEAIDKPGMNYVIARTAKGARLMRDAVKAGHLAGDARQLGPGDFEDVQPHQSRKRRALKARMEGIASIARLPVVQESLYLDAVSLPAGAEYDRQKAGSARRYRDR